MVRNLYPIPLQRIKLGPKSFTISDFFLLLSFFLRLWTESVKEILLSRGDSLEKPSCSGRPFSDLTTSLQFFIHLLFRQEILGDLYPKIRDSSFSFPFLLAWSPRRFYWSPNWTPYIISFYLSYLSYYSLTYYTKAEFFFFAGSNVMLRTFVLRTFALASN